MKYNRTTLRVTQILKLLASRPDGMTLSEIGQELGIPVTSVFDIVQTLRAAHFLRERNKRFAVGFMVREVGEGYMQKNDLYSLAKERLVTLAQDLDLVASLVLYEDGDLNYVFQYRPKDSIIAPGSSGGVTYMHASATGKVFLAFMSPAKREKALKSLNFMKFTDKTIRNAAELLQSVEQTRLRGYGLDEGEFNPLLTCMSAPVLYDGRIVAAVTLSGLQLSQADVDGIVPRLAQTAGGISEALCGARAMDG